MNPYLDDFPLLRQAPGGRRLVYLDSAATTQKPFSVLHAVEEYYRLANANPYRGLYDLSVRATEHYEAARRAVQVFIHARDEAEVVFTRNATEALNVVAYSYGLHVLQPGDEIAILITEHHSNLVPWQMVARSRGATLRYLYCDGAGRLADKEIKGKIGARTRIVAAGHVSNVLGTINPVEKLVARAHDVGAVAVLDCAQSIPHLPIDVQVLGADFVAFSGHKMLAPMGIGVLWGRRALLERMPPFQLGGEMIASVGEQEATFAPPPAKFEAGTPNVGGAVGLAAAIAYLCHVGHPTIAHIEADLVAYTLAGLAEIPHVTVYGPAAGDTAPRSGVISFNVEGVHPHDVASILDAEGIAIRAGHHCAQPLMRFLGIGATCRVSLYLYNSRQDVDALLAGLKKVRGWLNLA